MEEIKTLGESSKYLTEKELAENIEAINKRRKDFGKSKLEFTLADLSYNIFFLGRKIPNLFTSFFKERFPYGELFMQD